MPTYVEMACPKCQKVLRVRTEYLGQRVVCRHCQDGFKVSLEGVSARLTALAAEVQQVQSDLVAANGTREQSALEVQQAREELSRSQTRLHTLEGELRAATTQTGTAQELVSLREERDRLNAEAKQLRGQVEATEALAKERDELAAAKSASEQLALEFQAAREELTRSQARILALESELQEAGGWRQQFESAQTGAAQELVSLRVERDRLSDEVKQLGAKAEVEAALQKERDELAAELEDLRGEIKQAATRWQNESLQVEELRTHADKIERAFAEATTSLEAERLNLADRDQRLQALETYLGRATEMESALAAATQAQEHERKTLSALEQEHGNRLKEVLERLRAEQERAAAERQVVEDLRAQVCELEKAQDEANRALDESRRAIESGCEELADRDRRITEIEDRLRTEQESLIAENRFATELRGQVDELEQALAEAKQALDESRQEVESQREKLTDRDAQASRMEESLRIVHERAAAEGRLAEEQRNHAERLEQALAEANRSLEEARRSFEEVSGASEAERQQLRADWEAEKHQRLLEAEERGQLEQARAAAEREWMEKQEVLQKRFDEERAALEDQMDNIRVQIAAALEQRDMARERVQNLTTEQRRLTGERQDVDARVQQAKNEMQSVVGRLTNELTKACQERDAEAQKAKRQVEFAEGLQEKLEQLHEREVTLRSDLEKAQAELQGAESRQLRTAAVDKDGMEQVLAVVQWEYEKEKEQLLEQLAQARHDFQQMRNMLWGLGVRV